MTEKREHSYRIEMFPMFSRAPTGLGESSIADSGFLDLFEKTGAPVWCMVKSTFTHDLGYIITLDV